MTPAEIDHTLEHCPQNKAHGPHAWARVTGSPVFGEIRVENSCPGHDESHPRHIVYMEGRAVWKAERGVRQ